MISSRDKGKKARFEKNSSYNLEISRHTMAIHFLVYLLEKEGTQVPFPQYWNFHSTYFYQCSNCIYEIAIQVPGFSTTTLETASIYRLWENLALMHAHARSSPAGCSKYHNFCTLTDPHLHGNINLGVRTFDYIAVFYF